MTVAAHNRVLRAADERAGLLEPKLAGLVRPVLERAGRDAARRFRATAVDHLAAGAGLRRADRAAARRHGRPAELAASLAIRASVDVQATSTMVCVKPRPDEAAAIADPDGGPAENLHVTLAYLGELDGDLRPVLDALRAVAGSHAPLSGVVGGYGQFGMPDGSRVGILLPDVPGLVELRVAATEALHEAGLDYGRDHGFEAHLTVDGDPEPGELEKMLPLAGSPLHFDELLVVRGDAEVHPLPLVGPAPVTAAAGPPGWTPPAGPEVVDAGELARKLRAKVEPVRQAVVKNVAGTALAAAGIAFDVTNPLIAGMIASAGGQIQGIAETTQADVVRAIRDAYDLGLSIPQAAELIQESMYGLAADRATLIARTELAGAVNGASLASTQLVQEVTGDSYWKRWMTAPGAKYPRHELDAGLDGQTVALDEYFDVNGAQLQYPGDPSGPAEEVIQCRCAMSYTDEAPAGQGPGAAGEGAAPAEDASSIAARMIDDAVAAEPAVTGALSAIADAAAGEMVGLDFSVKSAASLERKIGADLAEARITNPDATVAQAASKVSDTLRYTMQFSPDGYAEGVRQAVSQLREAGYGQVKLYNYWGNADYQGINAVFQRADGTRFELQFHTARTFALKTELHAQYEAYRKSTSAAERRRLWDEMAAAQKAVQPPPGSLSIGQPRRHDPS